MTEICLKILIVGDSNVGKTSLLLKYTDGYFPESHVATIGVEYKIKTIKLKSFPNIPIKLQIWDTSGQERFRSLTQNFFRNANGVLFVYDLSAKKTFENIKEWMTVSQSAESDFKALIIGNKCDLEEERKVSQETLKKFCEKKNIKSFETSAKNNINVSETFETLAELILENKNEEEIKEEFGEKNHSLSVYSKKGDDEEKKGGCCGGSKKKKDTKAEQD